MGELDSFTVTPKEVQNHQYWLEQILLAKPYTRKKIIAQTSDVNLLRLLIKLLLLVVFKKRQCADPETKKKLFYKKRFILERLSTQRKISILLKSERKLRAFWMRLNTLTPYIIACFITNKSREEN